MEIVWWLFNNCEDASEDHNRMNNFIKIKGFLKKF